MMPGRFRILQVMYKRQVGTRIELAHNRRSMGASRMIQHGKGGLPNLIAEREAKNDHLHNRQAYQKGERTPVAADMLKFFARKGENL